MKRLATTLALFALCAGCSGEPDRPMAEPGTSAATPAPDDLAEWRVDGSAAAGPVATVQALFDALERGDADLLRSVVDPTVVMHFSETRDGATTFGSATVDALATRITSSDVPLIERMWSPTVVIDGPMATVWTPYDFYAGDEFSHCGVDTATLMQTTEGWRIVALSWTRQQPPACSLHPDGPPSA